MALFKRRVYKNPFTGSTFKSRKAYNRWLAGPSLTGYRPPKKRKR